MRLARASSIVSALSLLASTTALATPAAALAATGDQPTIAYYRTIVANSNALSAVRVTENGYMAIDSYIGKVSSLRWEWGGKLPSGYIRAKETITYRQANRQISWISDLLTPVTQPGYEIPVLLLMTRGGDYAGYATATGSARCFYRYPASNFPYSGGHPLWSTGGNFEPRVRHGNQVKVTSTYRSGGRSVTEVDTVDATTKLFTGSVQHFGKGTAPSATAYTAVDTYKTLVPAPRLPNIPLCK